MFFTDVKKYCQIIGNFFTIEDVKKPIVCLRLFTSFWIKNCITLFNTSLLDLT